MRAILIRVCWVIFAALIVLLIFALTPLRERLSGRFEMLPGIPLILLGLALVVLAITLRMNTVLKGFMIATGASAIGWPSSLFLHSFLYQYYPTEPVTYILFFFVFPLAFAVGAIGSIVAGIISASRHNA